MLYGWSGASLEVDLSTGSIEKSQGDRGLYESYLGGKGTNARTLWERVGPEVDPFSPDNPLIIGAGVLTGTIVPSANRAVVTFRSPQTGIHHYSGIGGFWPPELKRAGYDTLIVSGRSPAPVYLWINDDKTEIRDASHLWGKGTHETKRLIREELNSQDVQVICIGPAGENSGLRSQHRGRYREQCEPRRPRSGHGRQEAQGDCRPRNQGHLCRQALQACRAIQFILDRTGPLRNYLDDFSQDLNVYEMYAAYLRQPERDDCRSEP